MALRNDPNGRILHAAIRKHGWDAFDWEMLEGCEDRMDLDMAERQWVRTFNSLAPNGYNLEKGGALRKEVSDAARKRMSEGQKGRVHSPETRRRMSEARKGKSVHPVHRDRLGALNRGKPKTDEQKRIISEALTGRVCPPSQNFLESRRRGSSHLNSKITYEIADEIRRLYAAGGTSYVKLGRQFDIDQSNVALIVKGRAWVRPETV